MGWFQPTADTSLRLVTAYGQPSSSVIDVGAGASSLADELLDLGWTDVTALDVSSEALAIVRRRLDGDRGSVSFVVANLVSWQPRREYDLWHDRAVFHFLVDAADRQRYVDTSARAVKPGGFVVLGTFADDGPTLCSGLPTQRYDAYSLAEQFGTAFELVHSERYEHVTPGGVVQPFTWVVLRRRKELAGETAHRPRRTGWPLSCRTRRGCCPLTGSAASAQRPSLRGPRPRSATSGSPTRP